MQMLLECLYSSNKRAKNWRDKEREWRSCRYDEYDNESKARDKKKEYYRQKEIMLSVLKPVCIHRETIYNQRRERIYDYEDEYEEYLNADAFFHTGEYWDNDLNEYVQFGDVYLDCDPVYHYYLFYDVGGNHTFHTPINEEDLFLYDLEVMAKGKTLCNVCGKEFSDYDEQEHMKQKEIVTQEHYFSIPKDYSYVDKVYFYDKKYLIPQIDKILEEEKDSKIIVFCNSITRMLELYKKYENQADYAASQNAVKVKDICNEKCVYEHKDGTVTFDKRILVTTKVLDNGINIKDKKVKHIFSEILDADSAIQALGRKRRTSEDDTCTFYLKNYSGQAIQGLINTNEYQLEPVMTYRIKYDEFLNKYGQNRKRIRNNKIFYTKFSNDKDKNNIAFNEMRLNKYLMDNMILGDMKEGSYKSVMIGLIGYSLPDKVEELEINIEEKDGFLEYLKSIEGKWLYSAERKEVVKRFEDIGVKLRRQGINTLNGALQDFYENRYKCRFRNKQIDENGKLTKKSLVDYRRTLEDGSINPMRNKAYWILE